MFQNPNCRIKSFTVPRSAKPPGFRYTKTFMGVGGIFHQTYVLTKCKILDGIVYFKYELEGGAL